jgi:hypothetical protein
MPLLSYNFSKGYTEFRCDNCGKIVPFNYINMFGYCPDCQCNDCYKVGYYSCQYSDPVNKVCRKTGKLIAQQV